MKSRFQSGRSRLGLTLVVGSAVALALALLAISLGTGTAPRALADYCDTHTCTQSDVTWTGNGTNNGYCSSFEEDANLNPGPNQQGWLFILTSPYPTGPWTLTATFDPGGTKTVTGVQQGNGSVHFIVYSPAGAQLLSASATYGIEQKNSILTVSHCEGVEPTPTPTRTETPLTGDTPTPTHTPTHTPTATIVTGSTPTPTPFSQVSPGEIARALPSSGDPSGNSSPVGLPAAAALSAFAGLTLLFGVLKLAKIRMQK